jgi:hypothetical protein
VEVGGLLLMDGEFSHFGLNAADGANIGSVPIGRG